MKCKARVMRYHANRGQVEKVCGKTLKVVLSNHTHRREHVLECEDGHRTTVTVKP